MTASQEQKIRVLHIDDEGAQLTFAKMFLEEADPGLEVSSYETPALLLESLDETVDCVVSDYVMPEMDGMELCQRIKERMNVPFILYTGRGSEVVAEAAFKQGVDDYVRKESDPSHYQLLARRIRSQAATYRRLREQRRYQERLEELRGNLGLLSEANHLDGLADTTFNILEKVFGYSQCCFVAKGNGGAASVFAHGMDASDSAFKEVERCTKVQEIDCVDGVRVAVPLSVGDVSGCIVIKDPGGYCEQDRGLLETLGILVSQSLHRVAQMERVQASEEQFRSIVENVQDVIVLTRPEGSVTYISP
ncbi:hybrid sensor histidine kinase/response regulator, partial [Candidatus Bathyarchaeota archaeon]|nr:hybrid sensor histidine kinase/response regulator [Candidatus Bathyarchaeota archaeon]